MEAAFVHFRWIPADAKDAARDANIEIRMEIKPINIFYEEPDPDRFMLFDRYPRRLVRRLIRGKARPGSIQMIATGLMAGLDQLGVPFRFNDYRYIRRHEEEVACIIGKPHLLDKHTWRNPILFGAGIFSHPVAYPHLLKIHPNIKKILVPGPWVQKMFTPAYGNHMVTAWPVGIDTDRWQPSNLPKQTDVLVYCKFLWDKIDNQQRILRPVLNELTEAGLSHRLITYGNYTRDQLKMALDDCRCAIFLCEHESQGMAYQQMLSSGVPILAWDRQSFWLDPAFYPDKVRFQPASSVPYWDERCGLKFTDIPEFKQTLPRFIEEVAGGAYAPRAYIMDHLTLKKSAQSYLNILSTVGENFTNR